MNSLPENPAPSFYVREIPIHGDAILAPMDGFSDWPFRSMCRALGSAMSYTEFVRAQHIVQAYAHMAARLTFDEVERPMVFRFTGTTPMNCWKLRCAYRTKNPILLILIWAVRRARWQIMALAWG